MTNISLDLIEILVSSRTCWNRLTLFFYFFISFICELLGSLILSRSSFCSHILLNFWLFFWDWLNSNSSRASLNDDLSFSFFNVIYLSKNALFDLNTVFLHSFNELSQSLVFFGESLVFTFQILGLNRILSFVESFVNSFEDQYFIFGFFQRKQKIFHFLCCFLRSLWFQWFSNFL